MDGGRRAPVPGPASPVAVGEWRFIGTRMHVNAAEGMAMAGRMSFGRLTAEKSARKQVGFWVGRGPVAMGVAHGSGRCGGHVVHVTRRPPAAAAPVRRSGRPARGV